MNDDVERYERWEPLASLPESPITDVDCSFEDGELIAVANYTIDSLNMVLQIQFDYVEAFKIYEEFSDPWMSSRAPLPSVKSAEFAAYRWPLQEVIGSVWIKRVAERNGGVEGSEWRHLIISTLDRSLHVMTKCDPKAVKFEEAPL
ncbi:hypothetical protein [Altererythrobacter sp. ZODW24]|uniref:hypothetical protein n=1 Tax=Altererythrobacter sp. ZODW24 TaxID=2185142 RepID=UPI000DF73A87|nr:hypothetical protein [Altererythrobacter sp. ZODW24]